MADNAHIEEIAKWVGALLASGTALVGGGAAIRKRWVKDQTEMTVDKAEGDFVLTLLKERDDALAGERAALEMRQKDVEAIGRLTSQTQYQQQEIERLIREMGAFKKTVARMYPEVRRFVESEYSDDIPPPPRAVPPSELK